MGGWKPRCRPTVKRLDCSERKKASLQWRRELGQRKGAGLIFEMRGSLNVLLGQVEKELEKRKMSTQCDSPCKHCSAAERSCAVGPLAPPCTPGPSLWGFGGYPQGRSGLVCVCQHLSEVCLPLGGGSPPPQPWGRVAEYAPCPLQPPGPHFQPCPAPPLSPCGGGAQRAAHRGEGGIFFLAVDRKHLLPPMGACPGWVGRESAGGLSFVLGLWAWQEERSGPGSWGGGGGMCVHVCVRECKCA